MNSKMVVRVVLSLAFVTPLFFHNGLLGQDRDALVCSHTNDNDVPTNHINRGLCHMSRNYLFGAKGEFQFVIGLTKETETYSKHVAYLNLGVVYLMEDNQTLAIQNFLSAIQTKPDYPEAYFNLGTVYYKQKLLKKAEEAFTKAIDLQPDYGRAHYSLGFLYLDQKKYDLAKEHADKAVEYGVPFKTLKERLAKVGR